MARKYDLFVSYSHKDEQLVTFVAGLLSVGGKVFWARRDMPPGQKFEHVIRGVLSRARRVVVAWCCHAAGSEWVAKEVAYAVSLGLPLIPVFFCSVETPPPLCDYHGVDGSTALRHVCDDDVGGHHPDGKVGAPPAASPIAIHVAHRFSVAGLDPGSFTNALRRRVAGRWIKLALGLAFASLTIAVNLSFPLVAVEGYAHAVNTIAAALGAVSGVLGVAAAARALILRRRVDTAAALFPSVGYVVLALEALVELEAGVLQELLVKEQAAVRTVAVHA